jgi:hypothetical protein
MSLYEIWNNSKAWHELVYRIYLYAMYINTFLIYSSDSITLDTFLLIAIIGPILEKIRIAVSNNDQV